MITHHKSAGLQNTGLQICLTVEVNTSVSQVLNFIEIVRYLTREYKYKTYLLSLMLEHEQEGLQLVEETRRRHSRIHDEEVRPHKTPICPSLEKNHVSS